MRKSGSVCNSIEYLSITSENRNLKQFYQHKERETDTRDREVRVYDRYRRRNYCDDEDEEEKGKEDDDDDDDNDDDDNDDDLQNTKSRNSLHERIHCADYIMLILITDVIPIKLC